MGSQRVKRRQHERNGSQNEETTQQTTENEEINRSAAITADTTTQQVTTALGRPIPYTRAQLQPLDTWSAHENHTRTIPKTYQKDVLSRSSENTGNLQPLSSHAKNSPAPEVTQQKQRTETTAIESDIVEKDCPECGGVVIVENNEQFCGDCGLVVVGETVDSGPEWRAYNNKEQDKLSRTGSPVTETMHDKGLSTEIGWQDKDAYGRSLSARQRQKMNRLRKWDSRFKVSDAKERNQKQAFSEIKRMCGEIDLAEHVTETASMIYRKAHEEDLLPGRSIESVATASIYIALRQAGIPKTITEVMEYSRAVDKAAVTRARTHLERELSIEIEPPQVENYVNSVCSELDISSETQQKARELISEAISENEHSGKSPAGFAAAAVYAAMLVTQQDKITQEEASEAGSVCQLTIRNRYTDILKASGHDPDDISPPSPSDLETSSEEDANEDITDY